MDKTKMLENLCQKLIDGDMDGITIADLSRQALDSGIEPLEILENGISKGMEIVGKRFETGEAFLPELIFAADAFKSAMEVISPALEASNQNVEKMGKVLLATVKGDVHNLGKNILATVLETNGFDVVDIGVNQDTLTIIDEAEKNNADVIGLSAVMTTTMPYQKELIDTLTELGHRNNYIVMVGGGPVNQKWADDIGADGYGRTAMDAVSIATQQIKTKRATT
jgi:corrinoid protein of di/trimethylamine methyltransferase